MIALAAPLVPMPGGSGCGLKPRTSPGPDGVAEVVEIGERLKLRGASRFSRVSIWIPFDPRKRDTTIRWILMAWPLGSATRGKRRPTGRADRRPLETHTRKERHA